MGARGAGGPRARTVPRSRAACVSSVRRRAPSEPRRAPSEPTPRERAGAPAVHGAVHACRGQRLAVRTRPERDQRRETEAAAVAAARRPSRSHASRRVRPLSCTSSTSCSATEQRERPRQRLPTTTCRGRVRCSKPAVHGRRRPPTADRRIREAPPSSARGAVGAALECGGAARGRLEASAARAREAQVLGDRCGRAGPLAGRAGRSQQPGATRTWGRAKSELRARQVGVGGSQVGLATVASRTCDGRKSDL